MAKAKLEEFFCKLSVYIKVWVFKDFLLIAKIIYILIAENIKHLEKQKKISQIFSIPWNLNSMTKRYFKHLRASVSK